MNKDEIELVYEFFIEKNSGVFHIDSLGIDRYYYNNPVAYLTDATISIINDRSIDSKRRKAWKIFSYIIYNSDYMFLHMGKSSATHFKNNAVTKMIKKNIVQSQHFIYELEHRLRIIDELDENIHIFNIKKYIFEMIELEKEALDRILYYYRMIFFTEYPMGVSHN